MFMNGLADGMFQVNVCSKACQSPLLAPCFQVKTNWKRFEDIGKNKTEDRLDTATENTKRIVVVSLYRPKDDTALRPHTK